MVFLILTERSLGYVVAKQLWQKDHDPIIVLTDYEAGLVKYDCPHYFMDGVIS